MLRRSVLACVLLVASSGALAAGPAGELVKGVPNEETVVIREFLAVTGAADMGNQVMRQMMDVMKADMNDQQKALADRFIAGLDVNDLVDQFVMLYADAFTVEELRGLLAFFKSDLGRKYVAEMPAMMSKAMQIGQVWAMARAEELKAELERDKAGSTRL